MLGLAGRLERRQEAGAAPWIGGLGLEWRSLSVLGFRLQAFRCYIWEFRGLWFRGFSLKVQGLRVQGPYRPWKPKPRAVVTSLGHVNVDYKLWPDEKLRSTVHSCMLDAEWTDQEAPPCLQMTG